MIDRKPKFPKEALNGLKCRDIADLRQAQPESALLDKKLHPQLRIREVSPERL